jgi:multidrug efflux pump
MISRFFIDRPIFATVLSFVITLIGGISLFYLPIAQYPRITPPAVVVAISYPGASAQVLAETVAAPVEQQVTGVQGMLYMSSQMGNDGTYSLTVTFDIGVDLKTALVMVQNRVTLAMPQLPTQVQNQGITIRKKTPDILMMVNFFSPDGRYDSLYLSNYATIYVRDELLRVEGVSDINYQGQRDYSIRAWVDPQKLASRGLTALDVANAIRSQNLDAPAGQVGAPPIQKSQSFQLPINTLGRLNNVEQFGDIIVKTGSLSAPAPTNGSISSRPRTASILPNPISAGMAVNINISTGSGTGAAAAADPSMTDPNASMDSGGLVAPATGGVSAGGGANATGGASSAGGATTGGSVTTGSTGVSSGTSTDTTGGTTSPGNSTASTDTSTMTMPSIASGGGSLAMNPADGSGITLGPAPAQPDIGIVRLRDVARLELGAKNYNMSCTFDGRPAVGLSVYQLPGTNALDVAVAVRKKMEELKEHFPEGLDYAIGYDTTPFIRESVMDVVTTLLEAVLLVGLVVLVFLQDWRAMILPLIDVPVSIIGTFAVMAALGFSLNNISLFGLVLAIGIVVDDAIVVLENIERMMAKGHDARTATIMAMEEVTGPIVAVGLVLCAVFVPCAFISGITGLFFHQFAVTIAVSTVISAINAVTMTPSRAVLIFRKEEGKQAHEHHREALPWWIFILVGGVVSYFYSPGFLEGRFGLPTIPDPDSPRQLARSVYWFLVAYYAMPGLLIGGIFGWVIIRPLNAVLGWLFHWFNRGFDALTAGYAWVIGRSLRICIAVLGIYVGLLVMTYLEFKRAPTGFIPQQDQGRLIVNVQLPDSSSLQRSIAATQQVDRIVRDTPGVAHTVAFAGMSFLLQAPSSNYASMLVLLDPFAQRQSPHLTDVAIMARLRREWAVKVPEAKVTVYGASPIPGLGTAGGFKIVVEDRGGMGIENLQVQTEALVRKMRTYPPLASATTQFRSNTPQLWLDIDRTKAAAMGVSFSDVNQTLSMFLGSLYVNSYNEFGRHWQVTVQADGAFRNRESAIGLFQVRNNRGQMIPLGSLVVPRAVGGPVSMTRYNLYTAATINGNILGFSSGDAIRLIDQIASETLPLSTKTEWTDVMFMQIKAGNTAFYVFVLAIISVFLALSALYESWSLPLAVILVVPLCMLCSLAGVRYTNRDVNIFVQIGLVVLVGLACKNAILVVEYAKQLHVKGLTVFNATKDASRLRLRPILMTSFAFIFGVIPLMVASGAGAEMRRSLGIAVFSGMLGVTAFGIFLTPVFFYVITRVGETSLFASTAFQRANSAVVGAFLGGAVGYMLALLELVVLPWGPVVGATVGVLLIVSLSELKRRLMPLAAPRPRPPLSSNHNGSPGGPHSC